MTAKVEELKNQHEKLKNQHEELKNHFAATDEKLEKVMQEHSQAYPLSSELLCFYLAINKCHFRIGSYYTNLQDVLFWMMHTTRLQGSSTLVTTGPHSHNTSGADNSMITYSLF